MQFFFQRLPLNFAAIITALIAFNSDVLCQEEDKLSVEKLTKGNETSTPKMPTVLMTSGFGKFAAAIEAAGLTRALEEDGPFTCFAPSDLAFDAMPAETKKMLKENPAGEDAQTWIKYHFIKGVALKRDELEKIPGANGYGDKYLRVWVLPGKITINRVCEVVRFDIKAGNGFIHEVDRVLNATDESKVHEKNPK